MTPRHRRLRLLRADDRFALVVYDNEVTLLAESVEATPDAKRRALEAAHILPDRDVRGQPEIPNGLALCRIHHGAYDVGILGIDPDCRIHLRQDVLDEHDGPMLRHGLQEMHGGLIKVPRRLEHEPNRDYLAERFARFRAA